MGYMSRLSLAENLFKKARKIQAPASTFAKLRQRIK